jgi:tRNA pseudouridine55 synthase
MVSAVKVQGRRLYELAREGKEIHRESRKVIIHELLISASPKSDVFQLKIKCGSGTYVRSLVSDIAQKAGSLAHVGSLRRTAIGSFNELVANKIDGASLIGLTEGLRDYEMIQVDDKMRDRIRVGAVVRVEEFPPLSTDGPWGIVDLNQNLLAMYEKFKNETLKPAVVLSQER